MRGTRAPVGGIAYDASGYDNHGTSYNISWSNTYDAMYFNGINSYIKVPGHRPSKRPTDTRFRHGFGPK